MKKTNTDSPSNRGVEPDGSRKSGVGICPSDEEIICTWMEPTKCFGKWWNVANQIKESGEPVFLADHCVPVRTTTILSNVPVAIVPDLNALWEVQERLTADQWPYYMATLLPETFTPPFPLTAFQAVAHATAEQKIKALAMVLRPEVERNS